MMKKVQETQPLFSILADQIKGDVLTNPLDRCLAATDGSIFSLMPACVVFPKTGEDVCRTMEFGAKNGFSIHPRGAGSGLTGAALGRGIVIDFTRYMNRLISLDLEKKTFTCQPGYRLGELVEKLKGTGLFFPPDPSSGTYATFGGMYATNASGAHSVKYGNVSDYILDAEIVITDGKPVRLSRISSMDASSLPSPFREIAELYQKNQEIIRNAYPDIQNNVAGYNMRDMVKDNRLHLEKLFAGAEGTLGVATSLTFRLLEKPAHDALVVAYFDNIYSCAQAVENILPMGPSGIEIMDRSLLSLARETEPVLKDKIPASCDNVLLIEFDSTVKEVCMEKANAVFHMFQETGLSKDFHLAITKAEKDRFWALRKAAVPILYRIKGEKKILALIEDAAIPTNRLADYFTGLYAILEEPGVDFVIYGHIAKGLLHTRPLLNLKDSRDIHLLKTIGDRVFDLVMQLGGSASGEHGDGRLRTAYVKRMYPDIFVLFQKIRNLLDPFNLLNPEIKTADNPYQMQENLRFGKNYRVTAPLPEHLQWETGLVTEIEKCHGCSRCTTTTDSTRMCPVYKGTRDPKAAPKAKANLLRALVAGEIPDGKSFRKTLHEVMENCANCGSCRVECPSHVDIPGMVIEAKARYKEEFGKSIGDTLVSGIEFIGRGPGRLLGKIEPLYTNFLAGKALEHMSGLSGSRKMVSFAPVPLDRHIPRRTKGDGLKILLFSGCDARFIHPETGRAAVEVLASMGMEVIHPDQHCCGIPLLSRGLIKEAEKKRESNLDKWGELVGKADYIAFTCSSCAYALKKEWQRLSYHPLQEEVAQKSMLITELISRSGKIPELSPLNLHAAYHLPCHLALQENPGASFTLLSGIPGLALTRLASRCCGMMGTWGLMARNEAVSRNLAAGIRKELERISLDCVVTDCPSCRMQMEDLMISGKNLPVLHPVVLLGISAGLVPNPFSRDVHKKRAY